MIPLTLYHYTRTVNLPSILEEGLIPDKGISTFYLTTHTYAAGKLRENKIWLDTTLYKIKTPGNAVLAISTKHLDSTKLEKAVVVGRSTKWYVYHGVIPSKALRLIEKKD